MPSSLVWTWVSCRSLYGIVMAEHPLQTWIVGGPQWLHHHEGCGVQWPNCIMWLCQWRVGRSRIGDQDHPQTQYLGILCGGRLLATIWMIKLLSFLGLNCIHPLSRNLNLGNKYSFVNVITTWSENIKSASDMFSLAHHYCFPPPILWFKSSYLVP